MDCQQFLIQFSEYVDGRAEETLSEEMETHRSACEQCGRYARIVETGVDLLKTLPDLDLPADFRPRLNHLIFHLEDGPAIAKHSLGTGATMFSVLAVAILTTLSAWAPQVSGFQRGLDLPAVTVQDPPRSPATPAPTTPTFPRNLSIFTTTEFQEGIWGDSHDLLREYSPILDRRREQALVRVGIE